MGRLAVPRSKKWRRRVLKCSRVRAEGAEDAAGGVLIRREYRSFFFAVLVASLGIAGAQRAAELHGAETEAIAQEVGGARDSLELGAASRGEEIELFGAVRQAAEAHAEEADFAARVAVL